MHVLHHGRAEYTLVHPTNPPRVEHIVMGTDTRAGEVRQMLVGTGVWKMSRLPAADLAQADAAHVSCLITEVVFPGFHWEDHAYLTTEGLERLFAGTEDSEERVEELRAYVKTLAA
jgi:predicted cupin superfamily sugar epimerase